jgi:beta-glucanase (GH16 family)
MSEPIVRPRRHRKGGSGTLIGAVVAVVLLLVGIGVVVARRPAGKSTATDTALAGASASAPGAAPQGSALPGSGSPGSGLQSGAPQSAEPSAVTAAEPTSTAKKSATPAATKKPAAATGVPAPPAGFGLTWSDAFSGSSGTGLDKGTYKYDTGTGTFGTGEIETMTDSTRNVFHDGSGHLVLKALHSGSDPAKGWTSGRFETQSSSFGAAKGGIVRMQASIQQPNVGKTTGAGYWPAFWMLGRGLRTGGTWPDIGEVDILEDVNGRSSVFGTLHCGVNPGGACNESSGIGSGEKACGGCQTGFHTYAVEIDRSTSPEQIRWSLDGHTYFTLSQSKVAAKAWTDAVDHPFFIIFDLAMGGGFPGAFGGGPTASTVSGGAMKIDYVAVYNKK